MYFNGGLCGARRTNPTEARGGKYLLAQNYLCLCIPLKLPFLESHLFLTHDFPTTVLSNSKKLCRQYREVKLLPSFLIFLLLFLAVSHGGCTCRTSIFFQISRIYILLNISFVMCKKFFQVVTHFRY